MGISDLFVSYNQVQAPSYLNQPQPNYSSDLSNEDSIYDNAQLFNQELYDRINNRPKSVFAGWNPIEKSLDPNLANTSHTPAKGSKSFNLAMTSYLAKHPEDAKYRQTLTEIAAKESNFNPTVKNAKSSASGYFQFINSTRKQYAPHLTKEQFLNNPEEQISAAVKLLKANRNISSKFANLRGLSQLQIDYGMWFSPAALSQYLKTGKSNFKDPQGTSLMTVLNKMA